MGGWEDASRYRSEMLHLMKLIKAVETSGSQVDWEKLLEARRKIIEFWKIPDSDLQ